MIIYIQHKQNEIFVFVVFWLSFLLIFLKHRQKWKLWLNKNVCLEKFNKKQHILLNQIDTFLQSISSQINQLENYLNEIYIFSVEI